MDVVNFGHSVKDIPVPSKKEYRLMMINSAEKYMRNLRWRVLHFLNPNKNPPKETYGFKSIKNPKAIPELKDFEADLIDMVTKIEFEVRTNKFQQKLNKEKESIEKEPKLIVGADKTSNYYKILELKRKGRKL